jgi:hypothetical protein
MVLEIFTRLVAVAARQSAGPELSSQFREQKRASELREALPKQIGWAVQTGTLANQLRYRVLQRRPRATTADDPAQG